MVKRIFAILLLLCVCQIGTPLLAQRSVRFGVAASAGIATGSFSELVSAGPGFLLTLSGGSNTSIIGFRIDVSDHLLKGRIKDSVRLDNVHVTAITANVVVSVPLFRYVKPYAMGGVGIHPFRKTSETNKRSYDPGISAGLGATFPFVVGSGFTEVRYHRIYGRETSQRYVPIAVGLMF
jgi:hypothetical protein